MKKIILILLIPVFGCDVFAQLDQGTMLLNGNVNFYGNSNSTANTQTVNNLQNKSSFQNFNGGVNLGYFVVKNLAVGPNYLYTYSKYTYSNDWVTNAETIENSDNIHHAGLFARYYLMTKNEKFGFYLQAGGSYLFGNGSQKRTFKNPPFFPPGDVERMSTGFSANFSPGVVYFISKRVALEVRMGSASYQSITTENKIFGEKESEYKNDFMQFNFGISNFSFGASFHFGGNKQPAKPAENAAD